MTLAIIYSRATTGIHAPLITVEVHHSRGLPRINIVGLPEAAVRESKDRVRSALLNTHFEFPRKRITINLAPADLPKEGGRFDLAIALGILAASNQLPKDKLSQYEFVGELALSGELRGIKGILPVILGVSNSGRTLIIPYANANEASVLNQENILVANHILEVCAFLSTGQALSTCKTSTPMTVSPKNPIDLSDVRDQAHAKRALEIAAAGKHSLLFIGPPGTGKTMLASRIKTILPELDYHQAMESAAVASISRQGFDPEQWRQIPFRSPHHSCSSIALVGGGRPPSPGEISLAHHGILFLDELTEFSRPALESLREPLEAGKITISRASYQEVFPANFQMLAAMNPCPCGYAGSSAHDCSCTREQVQKYLAKISGPLLDRIDMHVEVPRLPFETYSRPANIGETSEIIKKRVSKAQSVQFNRQGKLNEALAGEELNLYCALDNQAHQLLANLLKKFNLSARAYHRILKIARTLADLSSTDNITKEHISEALAFRCLDRTKFFS